MFACWSAREGAHHVRRSRCRDQFHLDEKLEDAIVQGIDRANKTLRNVKSAWVKDQEARVDDGKVVADKVNLKVTFVLDGQAG